MEVKKVATTLTQSVQNPNEANPRPNEEEKTTLAKDSYTAPDRLQLSRGYQEMAQAKKVMMQRDDIRLEQVDRVRNMIENKTYQIQPEKIAAKMMDEAF
jgi:negative regulator of flagellin synthesis FlgM